MTWFTAGAGSPLPNIGLAVSTISSAGGQFSDDGDAGGKGTHKRLRVCGSGGRISLYDPSALADVGVGDADSERDGKRLYRSVGISGVAFRSGDACRCGDGESVCFV